MPGKILSTTFQATTEDGSLLAADDLPANVALRERRPAHPPMRIRGLDGV